MKLHDLQSKILGVGVGLLTSVSAFALNTTVTLHADSEVSPSSNELVTFGLPLSKGDVTDIAQIRVSIDGSEVAAYVEEGLRYHWSGNSLRSVTIQLDGIDMTGGDLQVQITDDGSTVPRVSEKDQSLGWATASSSKNNLPYPRIFALHDPNYLSGSGIIPPFEAAPSGGDDFEDYQVAQFNNWAGGLNYGSSAKGNWLFDRSSAMFKAYMTTGRVEFLKEAFLSKQFYFNYVRNDGTAPAAPGGSGCWTYSGVACADGKYIAPQQAKLAWALVGDDSQWDSDLIANMALQADIGWNQFNTRDDFSGENDGFTERAAGLIGLAEIVAYEMTGNATVLSNLKQRINSLKDMQQTTFSWDEQHGWTPKSGAFDHNMDVHEGKYSQDTAPSGDTNARGFSPWMSENIVDFLWQTYWTIGHSAIPEMIRKLALAIDNYAFSTAYDAATNTHIKKTEFANSAGGSIRAMACNTTREDTDLVYIASAYADAAQRTGDKWWTWYSDTHNIELLLVYAAAYHFESNENNKTQLAARASKIFEGWINSSCANISSTMRLWNWQHRSNSGRTWLWVRPSTSESSGGGGVVGSGGDSELSPPNSPAGLQVSLLAADGSIEYTVTAAESDSSDGSNLNTGGDVVEEPDTGSNGDLGDPANSNVTAMVYVATTSCSEGDDPHWQCGGQWHPYNTISPTDLIAVCPAGSSTYLGCYEVDKYIPFNKVVSTDGLFTCDGQVEVGSTRNGCSYQSFAVFSEL